MTRVVPFLMFLVALFPAAAQAELPTMPDDVLPYLESVYKGGDIDAYEALLTSDYRFVMEETEYSWDAATDVKGTRALFQAAVAELSFDRGISAEPGPSPGTWIIKDVPCVLKVTQKKDGRIYTVTNTFTFTIRGEKGDMRIAEWRQMETGLEE
jgi:hypothetical protein